MAEAGDEPAGRAPVLLGAVTLATEPKDVTGMPGPYEVGVIVTTIQGVDALRDAPADDETAPPVVTGEPVAPEPDGVPTD